MESLLSGSIINSGYLLSNGKKNNRDKKVTNNLFKEPNNEFIYKSDIYNNIKNKEEMLASNNFNNAKNAIHTNIISPEFNNNIIDTTHNFINDDKKTIIKSHLSGMNIEADQFTHSNMLPFFGSKSRQNINLDHSQNILSNHTGVEEFTNMKSEQPPLFEPSYDKNIQYGTKNLNSDIQNRINLTSYKRNEIPFEKLQVGPGVNKGFTAEPSGGFHPDVREYVMPRSIDELRPKSNPQITYKGRVIPGKSTVGKVGKLGKTFQHKPNTFFVQNSDRYLKTTGAFLKETKRPCMIVKDTNRKYSKHYTPGAGPAVKKNATTRSLYKKSSKNIYSKDGPRNAYDKDGWKNEDFGDYGKKAIHVPSNERDITGKRVHTSNFTSIVKAIVAPILDVIKPTKKENTIGNIRQSGNFGTANVSKNVVWDSNDTLRTTIKETNIHDSRSGNMRSNQKGVAYDSNDIARTTIKETSIHDNRTGNIGSNQKGVAYDPNDIARTTIKETNIHDNRTGNLESNQRGVAYDPNDLARTTIKETNIHDNRTGNLESNQRGVAYDPNDIARTTIKETNIHDNRTGNLESNQRGVAYDPNDLARTTIRNKYT